MKYLSITVTALDIKRGYSGTNWCPIARAVNRKFHLRNGANTTVTHRRVYVGWRRFSMSSAGRDFVKSFDMGLPCRPFTLELEAK